MLGQIIKDAWSWCCLFERFGYITYALLWITIEEKTVFKWTIGTYITDVYDKSCMTKRAYHATLSHIMVILTIIYSRKTSKVEVLSTFACQVQSCL